MFSARRFVHAALAVVAILAPDPLAHAGLHLHGGAPPVYEGLVASRARMLQENSTITNRQIIARSAHIATENLTSIKVVFGNFYNGAASGGGPQIDSGLGAATTVSARIEYPAGTFTRVTFSAANTGSIPDKGALASDYIAVNIPSGATFWVPSLRTNANGILFNNRQNTFLGEASIVAASGLTDAMLDSAITSTSAFSCPPLAILGMTSNASVIIVGDSIGAGVQDVEDSSSSATGYNAKIGSIARSLGSIPFLNLSVGGEQAQFFLTDIGGRANVIQKGSHLISEMGVNDIMAGNQSSAQLTASLQGIYALARPGQKIYQTTITPESSSTDAFATVINQTTNVHDPARQTFNAAVRAGLAGVTGFYEAANVVESSQNSGLWRASPTPPYTSDGIHPNATNGYPLFPASGAISPVVWP